MRKRFDAIVLAAGTRAPRDLDVPGRALPGVHFAMDFLTQQNRRNAGDRFEESALITATGKRVVVIGGGDTGADCVGTSRRQGAREIHQLELLPKPPERRAPGNPWPTWPNVLRTGSSHEEGCNREWSVLTEAVLGAGRVEGLRCVRLAWPESGSTGPAAFEKLPGSEFEIPSDLVLVAMGFTRAEYGPLLEDAGIRIVPPGRIEVGADLITSVPGVFAAGDCVAGASLVVRAMALGRRAATAVHAYLIQEGEGS